AVQACWKSLSTRSTEYSERPYQADICIPSCSMSFPTWVSSYCGGTSGEYLISLRASAGIANAITDMDKRSPFSREAFTEGDPLLDSVPACLVEQHRQQRSPVHSQACSVLAPD